MSELHLTPSDALVIVDVQNDFLTGGALAVQHGEQIIPVLNRYIELFIERSLPVVFTRDWHPANHCSFKSHGGIWPDHCIAESHGAEFSPLLRIPDSAILVSKDVFPQQNTYSGFQETGLSEKLHDLGVKRLYIGGIATDYCVLHTVLDALVAGFNVYLLMDAICSVNVQSGDGGRAIHEMMAHGAGLITLVYIDDRKI